MKKRLANLLTGLRILCSGALMLFPAFSARLYLVYLLCGLSDMADGAVARKTNSASRFGARLDTAADLVFAAAALTKLLPLLHLPRWLWLWTAAIAAVKAANLIWSAVRWKRLVSEHTALNELTGLALFLLPLTLSFADIRYSGAAVCALASAAALQEGYEIARGREIV